MADAKSDIASLHVSLPQMLDLALGTPEVGAVNLTILHNFLHVLLHQINLKSTKVEYRGEEANRIKNLIASLKSGPTLHLQEYSITNEEGKVDHRDQKTTPKVEVFTAQESENLKKTKGLKEEVGSEAEGERQRVIFIEPIIDGVTPSALGFQQLEKSVNQLEKRFQALEELSTNPELVERLKGKMTDPVTDVWQIINITKRLEASETGIDKLTTMVQDVFKGSPNITVAGESTGFEERLTNLEKSINKIEETIQNLQVIADTVPAEHVQATVTPNEANVNTNQSADTETTQPTEDSKKVERTTDEQQATGHPAANQRVSLSQLLGGVNISEMKEEVTALRSQVTQIRADINNINGKIASIPAEIEKHAMKMPGADKETREPEKGAKTEIDDQTQANLKQYVEDVKKIESTQNEALQKIDDRLEKLESEVITLSGKVTVMEVPDTSGEKEINELVSKIQGIQTDMEKLNQTADRLIEDRQNRELHLNALLEQIEVLKTIKADKEDLEDALADKADAQLVNRKVSHDQFDAACDDLARGLEDAISKLGKQETIWQQALDEVQKEIEGKVDKIEISPLRDFVNVRVKSLQEKLKSIAEMRRENEAAGTKKLLRDVQCISCDKNVVMRTEESGKYRAEQLPCSTSIKPYLTYELDRVRKQQRRLPHSRNMIQFEAALQEETKKQKSARSDTIVKTPRDHLCNRYCGGSHTVISPQQRITRMGHFLTQWGPEIVQLTEGTIKGSDGKMYRSRAMPKFDVCGPRCEDKVEEVVRTSVDRPSLSTTDRKKASDTKRKNEGSRPHHSKKSARAQHGKETIEEEMTTVDSTLNPETQETQEFSLNPLAHGDRIVEYTDDMMDQDDIAASSLR